MFNRDLSETLMKSVLLPRTIQLFHFFTMKLIYFLSCEIIIIHYFKCFKRFDDFTLLLTISSFRNMCFK